MAVIIPLGNLPAMRWIMEDPEQMANAMQLLIQQGSNRNGIGRTQIRVYSADPNIQAFTSVAQAVEHGTRFFDAMLYFCINAADRPAISHVGQGAPEDERVPEFLATRLFCFAFYILTRGNLPDSTATTPGTIIPAILANQFGMNYSPNNLASALASFPIRNLNHTWIRYINWTPCSQLAQNRMALGVAGYRYIMPFKSFARRDTVQHGIDITVAARNSAFDTARLLATREYDWNIHPLTRSPAVIQALGPLNPNLMNLMLACFDDAQLAQMQTLRMIFQVPTENNRYNNYKTWNPNMVNWAIDNIF